MLKVLSKLIIFSYMVTVTPITYAQNQSLVDVAKSIIEPKQKIILKSKSYDAIVYVNDEAVAMIDSLGKANFSLTKGIHEVVIRKELDTNWYLEGTKKLFSSGEGTMTVNIETLKLPTNEYQEVLKKETQESLVTTGINQNKIKVTKNIELTKINISKTYKNIEKFNILYNDLSLINQIYKRASLCNYNYKKYHLTGSVWERFEEFKKTYKKNGFENGSSTSNFYKRSSQLTKEHRRAVYDYIDLVEIYSNQIEKGDFIIEKPIISKSAAHVIPARLKFFKVIDVNKEILNTVGINFVRKYPKFNPFFEPNVGFGKSNDSFCKVVSEYDSDWVEKAFQLLKQVRISL